MQIMALLVLLLLNLTWGCNPPSQPSGGKPGGGKPGGGKPSEGKPGSGKPSGGKPGSGKPGGVKPSGGKPGGGKPSGGRPGGGTGSCQRDYSGKTLTSQTVDNVKASLKQSLFFNRADRYAHTVRIAFHDCVGGCDGCINRDNPDNAGPMLETLTEVDSIYDSQYMSYMSRADFYILTAVTGLEEALRFNNANLTQTLGFFSFNPHYIQPLGFNFKYGRCDCPSSPTTAVRRNFPSGKFGYNEVMNFFRNEFGFTETESVAILGAHTLGGASGAGGSGFEGFWKEDATAAARLNNRYYSLLVDNSLNWQHLDISRENGFAEERWQWVAGTTPDGVPAPFMLNADVALVRDIQPDREGRSSCQFRQCSFSPSANIVQTFARDGNTWFREFVKVWDKMTAKGASNLKTPYYESG